MFAQKVCKLMPIMKEITRKTKSRVRLIVIIEVSNRSFS
jgi:hypothetical protein